MTGRENGSESWVVNILVMALGCFFVGVGGSTISYAMWMDVLSATWLDLFLRWEIGSFGLFWLLIGIMLALPDDKRKKLP